MGNERKKFLGLVVAAKANFLHVCLDLSNNASIDQLDYLDSNNSCRLLCTFRKRLQHIGNSIYVGDYVYVESIDWKSLTGVVSEVETRTNFLSHPPVANVTNILVVLSLKEPLFDLDQASRFLLSVEKMNLKISLILTKIDLVDIDFLNEQLIRIKEWGYNLLAVSPKTGAGMEALKGFLKLQKVSVVCGPSGVGKTSLLKHLISDAGDSLRIGNVSGSLKRGRHTTRNVELFSIDNGSLIADTPGFNRPDITFTPKDIAAYFPEFRRQFPKVKCKFRNCLHLNEPGCLLDKQWERYTFYRELTNDMLNLSSRQIKIKTTS